MAKIQTPTPAVEPVLSPARQLLKDVIEAQQRALSLVDKAQKVFNAAAAALEKARAEVDKYEELEGDAVKARLATLKGEPGAKSEEQIRASRRDRLIAKEELLSAELTLQAAQQELTEAHGNFTRGEKVRASHSTSLISEQATEVIALWEQVNEEREKLKTLLSALVMVTVPLQTLSPQKRSDLFQQACMAAGLPFGDVLDWQHLQEKAGMALTRNFAQKDPGPAIARARAYWAQAANLVSTDPAAEPAPLPSAAELFG